LTWHFELALNFLGIFVLLREVCALIIGRNPFKNGFLAFETIFVSFLRLDLSF
jgi:hypothetical protein